MAWNKEFWLDADFYRQALKLTLPVALQNMLSSSLTMVDNIMVGQLGDSTVAAVGLAGQWAFFMNLFIFGTSSGASVLIAQYWGAGDLRSIRQTFGGSVLLNLGAAVIFTLLGVLAPFWSMRVFSPDPEVIRIGAEYLRVIALGYAIQGIMSSLISVLRVTEAVKIPLYTSILSMLVNVVFNYIFIFGKLGMPAMGAAGAALATVISQVVQLVSLVWMTLRIKHPALAHPREMIPRSRAFWGKFIRIASPVVANESLWALGIMVYSLIFARISTTAVAGYNIMRNMEGLAMAFFFGMGPACNVLVGKPLGVGDRETAWRNAVRFLVAGPALSVLAGLLLVALRGPLVGLYNVSPAVIDAATKILTVFGLLLGVRSFNYFGIVGVLRAGGDTRVAAMIDAGSVWVVSIPLAALSALVFHWEGHWVYLMILVGDAVKTLVSIARIRTKKWMNTLTGREVSGA